MTRTTRRAKSMDMALRLIPLELAARCYIEDNGLDIEPEVILMEGEDRQDVYRYWLRMAEDLVFAGAEYRKKML